MGYTITIGELEVHKNPDDGIESDCISFSAAHEFHKGAPAFGEPTDFTNSRWPSYTAWSGALRDAGLESVFFSDGHLIGGHPGVRLVTKELVSEVDAALQAWKVSHPASVATFNGENADNVLCRLIWLDYWLKWAFANCETPVIANS